VHAVTWPRVPDAVQRLFGGAPQSRDPKAMMTMLARWTPDQQRTTPQERRAAQHPGNDTGRRLQRLSRRVLLVLAVLDQIVDHGGIRQRRGVAETSRLVLGDLAQDAAHDLAGTGFG